MSRLLDNLVCPITGDLAEDPITVPCCGKIFSRSSLISCFNIKKECPLCRSCLENYNPRTVAKSVIICDIINDINQDQAPKINKQKWTAQMTCVTNNYGTQLPISQLKLMLENSEFTPKQSLFILAVDKSGSMGGNPIDQVKMALKHVIGLSRSNQMMKVILITYDSYSNLIDVSGPLPTVLQKIESIRASGGTNFKSAFSLISDVLSKYEYSEEATGENIINNATICFLTDGQSGENAQGLLSNFKNMLDDSSYVGPIIVHSIGFSRSCDKNLLEGLWKSGSSNGTFRYAEPEDSEDTLCNKITSLFETVNRSSTINIEIESDNLSFIDSPVSQFPIGENKKGSMCFWVQPKGDVKKIRVCLLSGQTEEVPVNVIIEARRKKVLFIGWINSLIDKLANELLELTKNKSNYSPTCLCLHYSLIEKRAEAIESFLDKDQDLESIQRLKIIYEGINSLKENSKVNDGKLSDIRFGSKFKSSQTKYLSPKSQTQIKSTNEWTEIKRFYTRNNNDKRRSQLQETITTHNKNKLNDNIRKLIDSSDINHVDVDGNTALMLAAYCGFSEIVKYILETRINEINVEQTNNDGETAMTLAIKTRGFWKSMNYLINHGAVIPHERIKGLEKFSIDNHYHLTADIISNYTNGNINHDEINDKMSDTYIKYIYDKFDKENKLIDVQKLLSICIKKRLCDLIEVLIDKHKAKVKVGMLFDLCNDNELDLDLTRKLLSYVDINETDQEGHTLLFKASEKGSLPHVSLFISHGANIDLQNNLGNTPLWIACSKRYPCIIAKLLENGANVNHLNHQGNSPIYSICEKGPLKIAEMLIGAGANAEVINNKGESLLTICCRNGQSETLRLLLDYVANDHVYYKASVDGFTPLLAATESNKINCIKVLCEYGIDIHQKTSEDNRILQGATALHLAAFYNKIDSLCTLISFGADVNMQDSNGMTPLHIAVLQNNLQIVKLLKSNKADFSIVDKLGNEPKDYCKTDDMKLILVNPIADILMKLSRGECQDKNKLFDILIKYSESIGCLSSSQVIDILSDDSVTPLMEAIIYSNYDAIKLYLQLGADPNHKNKYGMSCYDWIKWVGNQRIKSLFPELSNIEDSEALTRVKQNSSPILNMTIRPQETHIDKINIKQRMDQFELIDVSEKQIVKHNFEKTKSLVDIFDKKDLWKAKIFAVNQIAVGENTLSAEQIISLYLYSNVKLIPNDTSYMTYLIESLNQLPPCENVELYVGTNVKIDVTQFAIGKIFANPTFISGSYQWKKALENAQDFFKGYGLIFIIKSKSGRFIDKYSKESEIVLLPNTTFKVTNWCNAKDESVFTQENIRDTAHRYDASLSKVNLIIELTEI